MTKKLQKTANLYKLYLELSRRKGGKLSKYNSGSVKHIKQLEFHKCQKRNRWVFGGNRTGKTECGAVEAIWLARGCHPYRKNKPNVCGWVVSLSTKVQKEVAQQKIFDYLDRSWIEEIVMHSGKKDAPEYGVVDTLVIKNVFGTTSKIVFKTCEEGRDKFQGASLDFVWFDEEPPKDIYFECKMRVMDKCGDIFGTMTPLLGLTFVYDEIYLNAHNDDEVWCEFFSWEDNPFLSSEEIARLSSSLSAESLESRKYGRFTDIASSQVYTEFDESVNVVEPFNVPKDWYDKISIDPGLHNPLSCHFYAVDNDNNIYVIAEHYASNKTVEEHSIAIKSICKTLDWPVGFGGNYEALIDSAASQRTLASEKSVVELFYDYGISVNPNVNKDLFSGISRVKRYFKDANNKPHIFIFKTCVNLIREIKGYFWGQNDAPIKRDDHALDELRYYIMSRPEYSPPTENLNAIQKDKRKLYRKIKNSKMRL
ncbi:MAG: terminase family protein [Clostridia bacterium]|nr:terminase family protein [Clostridia bacterium]